MSGIHLNALGLICALGQDEQSVTNALFDPAGPGGLVEDVDLLPGNSSMLGRVDIPMPDLHRWPIVHHSRNNALLELALQQIAAQVEEQIERHGPARIAVILGTSTSGVRESEIAHRRQLSTGQWAADFHYGQQEMGSPAAFVAARLRISGPAYTISTACSSSAKALASAARMLNAGLVDAVVAGGADSLCAFTVSGFRALGAVSDIRCNPFSRNRSGINIGEAASLFVVSREEGPVRLLGWGESSDAHHMSAPEPSGTGARAAIEAALQRAGLTRKDVDYINLHGTATLQNDAMEATVIQGMFGDTPCSSTKPMTGHTLGAAGALEAALSWLVLARNPDQSLPPHWWDGDADPAIAHLNLVRPGETAGGRLRHVLSQSFAFGGSNTALLLGTA